VAEVLKVPDVAAILKVQPATVYTWVRQGRLPHIRIGRLIRFSPVQVEEFLNGNGHAMGQKPRPKGDEEEGQP
jgi:excisionase family DNA binding protein